MHSDDWLLQTFRYFGCNQHVASSAPDRRRISRQASFGIIWLQSELQSITRLRAQLQYINWLQAQFQCIIRIQAQLQYIIDCNKHNFNASYEFKHNCNESYECKHNCNVWRKFIKLAQCQIYCKFLHHFPIPCMRRDCTANISIFATFFAIKQNITEILIKSDIFKRPVVSRSDCSIILPFCSWDWAA